jgi:predicted nucleic acid-binding protein
MEIVIDTSVLVGLLVPNDTWHSRSVALWDAIESKRHTSLFLDCVVAEAVSTVVRRLYEKKLSADVNGALERFNATAPFESITWVLPDAPRLYKEVLGLVRSSSGELSFNDALIALACRERDVPAVASFDADFDQVKWLKRLARPEDVL